MRIKNSSSTTMTPCQTTTMLINTKIMLVILLMINNIIVDHQCLSLPKKSQYFSSSSSLLQNSILTDPCYDDSGMGFYFKIFVFFRNPMMRTQINPNVSSLWTSFFHLLSGTYFFFVCRKLGREKESVENPINIHIMMMISVN